MQPIENTPDVKLSNITPEQPCQESKSHKASQKKVDKSSWGYSNFNHGKPIDRLSDVQMTDLIIHRISDGTFNTINVQKGTHTFAESDQTLFARKITLLREFEWEKSTLDFGKLKFLPAYIKEQVFGEESDQGRKQLQLASYLYKRVILWISIDCKYVDIAMDNYKSL